MFFRRSAESDSQPRSEAASPETAHRTVQAKGHALPVQIKRHHRARRISLKIDSHRDILVLTLPMRARERDALAFLEQHADWAAAQLSALPERVAFADGISIPLYGEDRRICHAPERRGGVFLEESDDEPLIVVTGEEAHLPRRLTDFLKREARTAIKPRATKKANAIGEKVGRISIRDQKTRWGSCTSSGDLNFSWRLVFCPEEVLDYVVAHEVAHLRHMDHSPAFWATVDILAENPKGCREWLRVNGQHLHRIG